MASGQVKQTFAADDGPPSRRAVCAAAVASSAAGRRRRAAAVRHGRRDLGLACRRLGPALGFGGVARCSSAACSAPARAALLLLAGEDGLRGGEHHRHVAAVLERALLDDGDLGELVGEPVEQRRAALGVGHLAAAEHDRDLDLVLVPCRKRVDVALLGVVVVLRDLRAELDLADRDLLLVLARGLLLLGLLVLVLRVVEHAADRRARLGGDLDEVEIALLGVAQRIGRLDDTDLLAVLADRAAPRARGCVR